MLGFECVVRGQKDGEPRRMAVHVWSPLPLTLLVSRKVEGWLARRLRARIGNVLGWQVDRISSITFTGLALPNFLK